MARIWTARGHMKMAEVVFKRAVDKKESTLITESLQRHVYVDRVLNTALSEFNDDCVDGFWKDKIIEFMDTNKKLHNSVQNENRAIGAPTKSNNETPPPIPMHESPVDLDPTLMTRLIERKSNSIKKQNQSFFTLISRCKNIVDPLDQLAERSNIQPFNDDPDSDDRSPTTSSVIPYDDVEWFVCVLNRGNTKTRPDAVRSYLRVLCNKTRLDERLYSMKESRKLVDNIMSR